MCTGAPPLLESQRTEPSGMGMDFAGCSGRCLRGARFGRGVGDGGRCRWCARGLAADVRNCSLHRRCWRDGRDAALHERRVPVVDGLLVGGQLQDVLGERLKLLLPADGDTTSESGNYLPT